MSFRNSLFSKTLNIALTSLALGALTLPLSQKAAAEECTLSVETVWLDTYAVEADAHGECGAAEVSLAVFNQSGGIEFQAAFDQNDLFGFYGIDTVSDMQMALLDWVSGYTDVATSAKLPVWPEGADGPEAGEFPFYVEEGVTREIYERARQEERPMVCFIQGTESQLCLVKNPNSGALESIGVQTFPG
ncbi:hypothetical protein FMN63_17950 [Stappia sp. BW2]|uniref:hypothetical protein n=1 Tax=Stappia sp. BW2 TaxID=2592622 RepID=UPI0011DE9C5B|nr:hypothetical protein [Stappia sp. BW2]TYC67917.1 hypothetical protein FMN63_17950 [Stappia sp. BW2]